MYHSVTTIPAQASRALHDAPFSLQGTSRTTTENRPGAASAGMRAPLPPGDPDAREAEGLIEVRPSEPNPKRPLVPGPYYDRESAQGAQVAVGPQTPGANPYGTIALDQGLSFADVLREPVPQQKGHSAVISHFNVGGAPDLTNVHPFVA